VSVVKEISYLSNNRIPQTTTIDRSAAAPAAWFKSASQRRFGYIEALMAGCARSPLRTDQPLGDGRARITAPVDISLGTSNRDRSSLTAYCLVIRRAWTSGRCSIL